MKYKYKRPRNKKGKFKRFETERELYASAFLAFFGVLSLFSVLDHKVVAKAEVSLPVAVTVEAQEEPKLTELPPVPFTRDGVTWTYVGPARDHSAKPVGTELTQAKKDSVAVQCEIAKSKHGWSEKDKTRCYYVMLAIAKHESGFREHAVGDGGNSHGAYQIYRKAHPEVKVEEATDWDWATSWTLNRLIEYGFPENEKVAIWHHNGYVPGLNEWYPNNVMATANRFEREKL